MRLFQKWCVSYLVLMMLCIYKCRYVRIEIYLEHESIQHKVNVVIEFFLKIEIVTLSYFVLPFLPRNKNSSRSFCILSLIQLSTIVMLSMDDSKERKKTSLQNWRRRKKKLFCFWYFPLLIRMFCRNNFVISRWNTNDYCRNNSRLNDITRFHEYQVDTIILDK